METTCRQETIQVRVADFILAFAVLVLGHQPELHRLGQLHQLVSEFLVGVDVAFLVIHAEVLDVLAHLGLAFLVTLAGRPFSQIGGQRDHLDVEIGQGKLVGVAYARGIGIVEHIDVSSQFLQLLYDGSR